jgi:hypothetical protein
MCFHDSGYYRKCYAQPGWKDTIDDGEISDVIHPLAVDGTLSMKHFNCMQKAITYSILGNGGSCPEEFIIRFLEDHWQYVNADRSQPFNIPPGAKLLHINTQARKHEIFLFLADRNERGNFMCNVPDDFKPSQVLIPLGKPRGISVQVELEKDSPASKLSTNDPPKRVLSGISKTPDQNGSPKPPEKSASPRLARKPKEGIHPIAKDPPLLSFDQHLLSAFPNDSGIAIEELGAKLSDKGDIAGPFSELPLMRRIRAVLIVLKSQKKVMQINDEWRITTRRTEPKPLEPPPVPPLMTTPVKDMTLADFYAFVKARAGPDRPM